ncbi:MAG: class I SAM-dependent methyltransferase [Owenweeksia sp.]
MKKWILKAIIQKTISWLPASQNLNFLFQKYITKGVRLSDQYFTDKLGHAADHLTYFKKHGKTNGFKVLELGSGWYPVVPVALFLAGAEEVVSIDVSSLMKRKGILETIRQFVNWHDQSRLDIIKPHIQKERLARLRELHDSDLSENDLLQALHLTLKVTDARDTGFADDHYDLVCSNNTFEHIYPHILKPIIGEFQRIVKPGGIMSHFIDMSDHFAHLDDSISIYNFLQYSPQQWTRIDNSVQPQNRLRLKDYRHMYQELGISIIEEKTRPGSIETVQYAKLHSDYAAYTTEEIAISHAHLVSTK